MKTFLFLIPSLAARGAERALVNLVNGLDKRKYRITVQTLFGVGELRQELTPEVEYRQGLPFLLHGYVQFMKFFSPQWLYRLIVRKKYDVVIAYLEGSVTRIISGCPYHDVSKVAWVHTDISSRDVLSYCFRGELEAQDSYSKIDRVVAVSHTVKSDFQKLVDHEVLVLNNVIEEERIMALSREVATDSIPSSDFNIICVGSLDPVKGLDRLIKVHQRLLHHNLLNHVYIIGQGPMESQLRTLIKDLHVEDTFHLLGYQSNPYKYMAKADLYVCSSRFEGLSTAVTEALILGLPVVSTLCSGARELLGDNDEYGLVVPNSEDGLFEGIRKMITSPELMTHYRAQARQRSMRFSKAETLLKHEDFFESLISESS